MPRSACLAVFFAVALYACSAQAQCPDGTPPPCTSVRAPRPPDPNRIAVLPFRVSADPELAYLRDGLVELVSAAFNGEVGPEAVESGETLRAWSRAGAGPAPSTPEVARRVARELSAGQVLYSFIVGNARAFTVTASILGTAGGVKVPPIQVEATADSIAALVSALSTRLLGASAGIPPTVSNEAAHAYLDGMALYRSPGDAWRADTLFARAIELDSTFVQASYRMALIRAMWGTQIRMDRGVVRNLWSYRQRLSPEQRILLEACADSNVVLFRTVSLPRMERAAKVLSNSAEASFILGNLYFSVGAATGREDWAQRSKSWLLRAIELDPTLAPAAHIWLADLAFLESDVRGFARYSRGTPWQNYQAALLRRNPAAIRSTRLEYAREGVPQRKPPWLTGITLPQSEVDSILALWQLVANTDEQRTRVLLTIVDAGYKAGRPVHAASARRQLQQLQRNSADSGWILMEPLMRAEDDSIAAERASSLIGSTIPVNSSDACNIGLSRLRRADTAGVAAILAASPSLDDKGRLAEAITALPRGEQGLRILCGEVLRGVFSALFASDLALLRRADSVMLFSPLNSGFEWNYDLGLAFARRQDYAAAASAARRSWWGLDIRTTSHNRRVIALRQEGRWSALAGDTASAIKAYEHYLLWRSDPEPVLIPQRDSVRAELAALQKRRRR